MFSGGKIIVTCYCTIFGEANDCNLLLHPTTKHVFENFEEGKWPAAPAPLVASEPV